MTSPPIHGPDHAADGPDPTGPSHSVYYAGKGGPGAATVTSPWTVAEIIQPLNTTYTNDDGSIFDEVNDDGAGKRGLRVLREGIFLIDYHVTIRHANASELIPPHIVVAVLSRVDGLSAGPFALSFNSNWTSQLAAPSSPILPSSADVQSPYYHYIINATHMLIVDEISGALPWDFTMGIVSWGGTADWNWELSAYQLAFLGPLGGTFRTF